VWIQCDECSRWCHGECAGFDKVSAEAVETYSCPVCTAKPRQALLPARQRPAHGGERVPSLQAEPASRAQGGRKRAKATAAARDAASNAAAAVTAPADTPAVPTADAHARDLPARVRKPLRHYEAGPAPPPKVARELAERVAAERSGAELAAGPLASAGPPAAAAAGGRATPGRKRQRGPAGGKAAGASGAAAQASPLEPLEPRPLLPQLLPPQQLRVRPEEAQLKPRPRGRAPQGKAWDHFCGVWVPLSELRPYAHQPHTQATANPVLSQASSGNLGFIELAENDPPGTLAAATAAAEALGLQVRQRPVQH